mmetsp:Transcript_90629/g.252044  ORF Transcript_90629/g.252044 Transcript_90629/m.252044 type:complete len:217 (+) Transcript_90629:418-1068(+)
MQGGAAALRGAPQEDLRSVAAQQSDLAVQYPEDAVPCLPQTAAIQLVFPPALEVRPVVVPCVLLCAVVHCDRNALRSRERHLQVQEGQFGGAEEVMRLPVHVPGTVHAELVQVNQGVFVGSARAQHADLARQVHRRSGRCRGGPRAPELVCVQGLPAAESPGVAARPPAPLPRGLARPLGGAALEAPEPRGEALLEALGLRPLPASQRLARGLRAL